MPYVFNADIYCDSCGESIKAEIDKDGGPTLRDDSDHYPQECDGEEPTDSPQHCGAHGDCLEWVDLAEYGLVEGARLYGAETRKIGHLIGTNLTEHGVDYLREMLAETEARTPYQEALHLFWREQFSEYLN